MKKNKMSTGQKIVYFLICALLIGGIGFFVYQIVSEVKTTITLKVDLSEAEAERDALQKENERLVAQKEKLSDDDYVITYARGQFLITKDGEQIFKLPSITDSEE